MAGKVFLVGAGPGDPDLITVKGRRVLERADVILYDHLANTALLDLAPVSAKRIYVGKKRTEHACTQEEISALLVEHAQQELKVVRLKGGDPFIFGRGGEELEALVDAGISFEVIPGVTSPLGIAAYTGVPLTHRDHTSVVTFVTGHSVAAIDWNSVAQSETLVIFMGLHHLGEIVERLVACGRSPATPAMAVEWGTLPKQRTLIAKLGDLAQIVSGSHLHPPATVIVGAVVSLHDKLSWFEKLPLFGKRMIVTRARIQATELVEGLQSLGAEVLQVPVIEMVEPEDLTAVDACIAQLESYNWLVFTSSNSVEFFFRRVHDLRRVQARICTVGQATASAVRAIRLGVDLVPEQSTGEGVARAFEPIQLYGSRVLFPRAAGAREVVPSALRAKGALVDAPAVYRNVVPGDAGGLVRRWLASGKTADWIFFASPSAVANFVSLAGVESMDRVKIATIGPTTSAAVRAQGLRVTAEAAEPSAAELIACVLHHR
ncbi:MAG TPA: uroporphyrinogen-III C-methyltransferase [Bryobacteraceae bacterium]|nr:uroporphyrinogen-III C-methyltransferase [Bryobacteraceae bacterium]